jgi:two-component system response regulator LytT
MALRVAIIEDEPATARNLKFLLQEADPAIEVLVLLGSVKESVAWLGANGSQCDLLFMDIRLNDGLSLEIFEQVTVNAPVIFVTAYNDYALQAFKANGIDYILKPIGEQELEQALARFKRFTQREGRPEGSYTQLRQLAESIKGQGQLYKQSFLVHFRDKLIPLSIQDICWFHSSNETTFARTADGRKLIVDFTLEQLAEQLDPQQFFRVNRQFIVHRKAIREIDFYFNGRLMVKTDPESEDKMLISKARVSEFKAWMNA